ncbi:MAG: hypothetical protein HS130_07975 [Deltaproteobacteria bacterium]|nr:hypothetical protein [Deltaproteobacteria bacterium]MCL4873050.1 hypothetical protein [bacterium]
MHFHEPLVKLKEGAGLFLNNPGGMRRSEHGDGGGAGEAGLLGARPKAERLKGRARRMEAERARSLMPKKSAAARYKVFFDEA